MDKINIYFVTCPHCHKEVSFSADRISRNSKVNGIHDRQVFCPECGKLIDEHNDKVRFRHILGDNILYVCPENYYPDGHMHLNAHVPHWNGQHEGHSY